MVAEEDLRWQARTPVAVTLPGWATAGPYNPYAGPQALYCPACDLISGSATPEREAGPLQFQCRYCDAKVEARYDPYQGAYSVEAHGSDGQLLARGPLESMTAKHYALSLCMTQEDIELVLAHHRVSLTADEAEAGTLHAVLRAVETRSCRRPLPEPVKETALGRTRDPLARRWLRLLPVECEARLER